MLFSDTNYSRWSVSDITREDVFTKEETYSHSIAYCELDIIYFTPVGGKKIYVGSEAGENFVQTLVIGLSKGRTSLNYNFWVGGFSSSNMLETNLESEGGFSLTPGKTTASTQRSIGKFDSREEAESAIDTACSLEGTNHVELYNFGFGSDGILVEGTSDRVPFYGNSTTIVMN